MNGKVILYGLGAAGVGYLLYRQFFAAQSGNLAVTPYSYPNDAFKTATLGGQPSQQYPYTAIQPARVDNTSQPWTSIAAPGAASSTLAQYSSGSNLDMNFAQNVQYLKGGADIVSSLNSIWDDIGGFWSDDTAAFGTDWEW